MWRHCRLASVLAAQTEAEAERGTSVGGSVMVPTGKESGKGKHCLSHLVGVEPEFREHRSTWKEDRVTRVLDHHQMMKMTLLVIAVIVAVFLPLFLLPCLSSVLLRVNLDERQRRHSWSEPFILL